MVKVKWWGHACFEIRDGKTIVVDPHDGESVGLKPPAAKADLVLISHGHYDHASGERLVAKREAVKIDKSGERAVGNVKVKGIKSYHDKSSGRQRGENTIFVFEIDGLRMCHLGDLGHVPTSDQVKEIGRVDVLFVPVGGVYTIDADEATEAVKSIDPKIVIPMHYSIKGLTVQIAGVDGFLRGKENVRRINSDEVEISKDKLPKKTEIWVLSYG
jgi:L-ascorbate metabolism protein UlaG (beta-lactamase superfamily)